MIALPSPLYAILDLDLTRARGLQPLELLDVWLHAGVKLVQLRAKTAAAGEFLTLADDMAARCRLADAMFIVNDRADIAVMSGAGGVHVGQDDLVPSDVRKVVGAGAVIGYSTHNEAQFEAACAEPVSYLAIGPVFGTTSKAQPDPTVGIDMVARAAPRARQSGKPLVAIGGITLETAPQVLRAGADAVAVISDLLVGDPGERVKAWLSGV